MANAGHRGHRWRELSAIVKREATHCWLCHGPLYPDRVWPDRWSTTVDYIDAFADVGVAGMVLDNLAAAHLTCNSSRGRRSPTPRPSPPEVHARDW